MFHMVRNKIRTDEQLNKLEMEVVKIVNQESPEIESFLEDLQYGGCASGMVGTLIYYTDTANWYSKFKKEINQLIKEESEMMGENILPMLTGWDKSDPLAMDVYNQNLLAWFSFETIANRILNDIQR